MVLLKSETVGTKTVSMAFRGSFSPCWVQPGTAWLISFAAKSIREYTSLQEKQNAVISQIYFHNFESFLRDWEGMNCFANIKNQYFYSRCENIFGTHIRFFVTSLASRSKGSQSRQVIFILNKQTKKEHTFHILAEPEWNFNHPSVQYGLWRSCSVSSTNSSLTVELRMRFISPCLA